MIEPAVLRDNLCASFCQDVQVMLVDQGTIAVAMPFSARDGDAMMAYLRPVTGGFRISDLGSTFMRLSYEHDIAHFFEGARGRLLQTVLQEAGLSSEDGEIYIDISADEITKGLFTLGQGLTRIEDIGMWSSNRVESTFYEDLRRILGSFLPEDKINVDYIVPGVPDADSYPVDFFIETNNARPLYLFGVNNSPKARLATIILQHLQAAGLSFESLIVCSNIDDIGKKDRNRLMNAANDVVPSIADAAAIQQKIKHRLTA